MADSSPLASVLAGPHLRTVANLDGRKVVVVEPLKWIEPATARTDLKPAELRIVRFLRQQGGFIPLKDIARALGIAVGAIKVHIFHIREAGIAIESGPYGTASYRLAEAMA